MPTYFILICGCVFMLLLFVFIYLVYARLECINKQLAAWYFLVLTVVVLVSFLIIHIFVIILVYYVKYSIKITQRQVGFSICLLIVFYYINRAFKADFTKWIGNTGYVRFCFAQLDCQLSS